MHAIGRRAATRKRMGEVGEVIPGWRSQGVGVVRRCNTPRHLARVEHSSVHVPGTPVHAPDLIAPVLRRRHSWRRQVQVRKRPQWCGWVRFHALIPQPPLHADNPLPLVCVSKCDCTLVLSHSSTFSSTVSYSVPAAQLLFASRHLKQRLLGLLVLLLDRALDLVHARHSKVQTG